MSRVSAGQVELTLEILLSDFKILHGHVWTLVTEELHDAGDRTPVTLPSISAVCREAMIASPSEWEIAIARLARWQAGR
jgi:hypothetical protein